ncbi:MAG: S24 family peptidase [Candidatus Aenigmatarchaeota archaeon]
MNKLRKLRKAKGLTLEQLSELVNISFSQIGKFERNESLMNTEQAEMFADFFGVSVDYLLGLDTVPTNVLPINNSEFKPIRILGSVRAGEPNEVFQKTVGYLMANVNDPDNHFYLQVVGDSMSPTLLDQDYVLVRFQNTANNNQIVVAGMNGSEATVKRLKMIGPDMFLFPDNENYEPIKLCDELHPYIVGVVVGLFRQHLK